MTKKKILMIDDDEEICEEMAEILQSEGYCVALEFNGAEGKARALSEDYDLLLLDLKLPGSSGYDILKSVKQQKPLAKVLVVSGRPFIRKYLPGEDIVKHQKKDDILKLADGFVNKPFDIELFLKTVEELLGRDDR